MHKFYIEDEAAEYKVITMDFEKIPPFFLGKKECIAFSAIEAGSRRLEEFYKHLNVQNINMLEETDAQPLPKLEVSAMKDYRMPHTTGFGILKVDGGYTILPKHYRTLAGVLSGIRKHRKSFWCVIIRYSVDEQTKEPTWDW